MRFLVAAAAAAFASPTIPATGETTLCTEIPYVPFTITASGSYCLKHDLTTSMRSGNAITVNANTVTIDPNSFKIGGAAAGPTSTATGISAVGRSYVTIRNGTIKGFGTAISLQNDPSALANHLVEDLLIDGSLRRGVDIGGGVGTVIRNNRVTHTGLGGDPFVIAILVASEAADTVVTDNMVTDVRARSGAADIYVDNSRRTELSGNLVSNVSGAYDGTRAILSIDAVNLIVRNNRLLNADAYGNGIQLVTTTRSLCIDNSIVDFRIPIVGCTAAARNEIL
jgi:hypothetical protein